MKRIMLALIPALVFLSACTLFGPSKPSVDVAQTSLALTMTAYPSVTPTLPPSPTTTSLPSPTITPLPSSTPSPLPSPTPTVPSPTPTNSPKPVIPPTAVPGWSPAYADQFIRYYYQHINARDYATTWSLLTKSFIANKNSPEQGGYAGYINFWNSVQRVDITNVIVTGWVGNSADVVVEMVYTYYNGSVVPVHQPFHLFYNSSRGTWMFDSQAPTAVPHPSTPDQFIYYYFNNINLRNYGLTWSLLADSFIAQNNGPAEGGYAGYVSFWNSVARVDVTYATINSQGGGYADVSVGLVFNYTSGIVTSSSQLYHLFYNSALGNWQFYSP